MRPTHIIADFVSRRHLRILLLSIVVTIVLAAGIPRLTMRPFFEGDLPADDPVLKANERYTEIFGKDEIAYLALVRDDGIYHASTLAKIAAITDELNEVDSVLSEETLSLATVRKVKWRDWGLDVRKYLSPLPSTPEEIERLREDVRLDKDIYDRLVSKDEKATLLVIRLEPGYDQRQLYAALHAIADKHAGPEQIHPFGHQVLNEETNLGIQRDAVVLGPLALLFMGFGIFLFFRSFRLTAAALALVAVSIIWTMGFMYYIDYPLSVLSSSIPAMLITIGSFYMIHVTYSCLEHASGSNLSETVREGVKKITVTILLSAGTSMVGFVTLAVFKILTIREFGVCIALGIGFAALLSLTVLPSIILAQNKTIEPKHLDEMKFMTRFLRRLGEIAIHRRYAVVVVSALFMAISIVGVCRIKVGYAPEEIFPKNHRARNVVSLFVKEFNGPYTVNAMFTAPQPDGLKSPGALRQIEAFQAFAEGLPKVKHSTSLVNIVKKMNRILNEDDPAFDKVPDSEEMVAQLLLLHSLTQDPVQFESMVDYDMQRCKVSIATTAIDSMQLQAIFKPLAAYCNEHFTGDLKVDFGGRSLVWLAMNEYIIRGKIWNVITNSFVVWIICAVAFRSVRLGFIGIVPFSLSTLATFGLMGHLGIRLDTATAVVTGISVGVGVDFAIYFIVRLKQEMLETSDFDEAVIGAVVKSGRVTIIDAMSNVLGFITLVFSGFAPVRDLGVLMCFTMVSCVLLTLLLIPTMIALMPVPFRYPQRATIRLRPQWRKKTGVAFSGPAK
jgi:hypothetical protein